MGKTTPKIYNMIVINTGWGKPEGVELDCNDDGGSEIFIQLNGTTNVNDELLFSLVLWARSQILYQQTLKTT